MDLSAQAQKEILQTAATQLGRNSNVLEKDIWVCWVLKALFSMSDAHPMAFKGGTSLSKVFEIIDRFSEDVDITLDYRHFDDIEYNKHPEVFDPLADGASNNQIRKFSDRLNTYVKTYALEKVIPHLELEISKLPIASKCNIEIDDTGEKIWLSYPSVIEETDDYLKSQVLVELGGRNVIDPNDTHSIRPYVSELTQGLNYPTSKIVVLSPERTFWEKATLIHVECNRGEIKQNAQRLSRHWYDLVLLMKSDSGKNAVNNRGLLEEVVAHKKVFFNMGYANYDECLKGNLKLLPTDQSIDGLEQDYNEMVRSGMMYQKPPSFDEIINAIKELEEKINTWNK